MPSIDDRTTGLQKLDGFLPLYWDEKTGSLWMEINKINTEILYSAGLSMIADAGPAECSGPSPYKAWSWLP